MARLTFPIPIQGWDPDLGFITTTTTRSTVVDDQGNTVSKVVDISTATTWRFPLASWAEKLITLESTTTTTKTTIVGDADPTTAITEASGTYRAIIEGKFRYYNDAQPYVKSGVVSKISILYNGGSWMTATDFAEDVHAILGFFSATDNLGLIDYLMGGSDTVQLSPGMDYLHTRGGNDTVRAGAGNDTIFGDEGDDTIWGEGGNDTIDGGPGLDIARYTGPRSQYTITFTGVGSATVSGPEGTDTLADIERIVFADRALALDTSGKPAQAYRLYKAAFDRTPDPQGLGYWIAQLDRGMDLIEAAARFVDSAEFRNIYGTNPTPQAFLTTLYHHVLHRAPDPTGLAWWEAAMASDPSKTMAKVLADFSESPENQLQVQGLMANGIDYLPWG